MNFRQILDHELFTSFLWTFISTIIFYFLFKDWQWSMTFDMDDQSFDALLEREKAYDLIEAVVCEYFDDSKNHKSYFFVSTDSEKYPYQLESDLQLDYLEICAEGCHNYGQEFLEDFRRSTHFFGVDSNKYKNLIWDKLKYRNKTKYGYS